MNRQRLSGESSAVNFCRFHQSFPSIPENQCGKLEAFSLPPFLFGKIYAILVLTLEQEDGLCRWMGCKKEFGNGNVR